MMNTSQQFKCTFIFIFFCLNAHLYFEIKRPLFHGLPKFHGLASGRNLDQKQKKQVEETMKPLTTQVVETTMHKGNIIVIGSLLFLKCTILLDKNKV